jgi:hypothetical protein
MTAQVRIQNINVALGTFRGPDGKEVFVYITNEHRRPLEQLAALVNAQQVTIEALTARLVAGGL